MEKIGGRKLTRRKMILFALAMLALSILIAGCGREKNQKCQKLAGRFL